MYMATHYDIERAIREAGLPDDVIARLLREVEDDFPDKDLMYELHVI